MSDRAWPSDPVYAPRTKEEWKTLYGSGDPEEKMLPAKLLKELSYAPRDYVKWPPDKKLDTIFRHQAEIFGEESLSDGGGGSGGKSAAKSSATNGATNGATKGKAGSIAARLAAKKAAATAAADKDKTSTGKKTAAKPQPVDEEMVPKPASGGSLSEAQLAKTLKAVTDAITGLKESMTEKFEELEEKLENIEAFATETHYAALCMAVSNENFENPEFQAELLGNLQLVGAEDEEGEE